MKRLTILFLLLMVSAVQGQANTYQFYPLSPTSRNGEAAAEHGVYGDGAWQGPGIVTDQDTIPTITGAFHESLALPNLVDVQNYGEAHTTAKFKGMYSPVTIGNDYVVDGEAMVNVQLFVDTNAPAGTFSYGAVSAFGDTEQELWALGPGNARPGRTAEEPCGR